MRLQWLRNPQFWLLCAAALIAAGSYGLAHRYLAGQARTVRAQAAAGYSSRDAVVAAIDLAAGERLPQSALATRAIPERFLASDAVLPADAGSVLGQRLLRPLGAGEVLTRSSLEPPAAASIASLVGPGERALTIAVDESSGAAGLLAPGDAIDLLLVRREEGDSPAQSPRVLPLLEAVPVIATGHAMRRRSAADGGGEVDSMYGTITLRLRPEQAERVLLAQKLGELSVAVRPPDEPAMPALVAMGREAVLGHSPREAARIRATTVEFIIGGPGGTGTIAGRRGHGGRT
jgi:pilus assembly protein CpaB